jgi:IS30 family transposase
MTGFTVMGKIEFHRAGECAAKIIELIGRHPWRVKTITADNESEFHSYAVVEAAPAWCSTSRPRTTPGSAGPTRTLAG